MIRHGKVTLFRRYFMPEDTFFCTSGVSSLEIRHRKIETINRKTHLFEGLFYRKTLFFMIVFHRKTHLVSKNVLSLRWGTASFWARAWWFGFYRLFLRLEWL